MSLLPCQTNVNETTSFFAPASGGGGGGSNNPNPAFSTITMANAGSYSNTMNPTQGLINWNSTLVFNHIGNQGNIYFAQGSRDTSDTSIIINSQNNAANLILGASDIIDGTFIASQYDKPLQLLAPTFVSSLNVSSINGAAPGGAVAPDIVVSSITFPNSQIDIKSGIKFSTILQVNDVNTSNGSDFFFVAGQAEQYLGNVSTNAIQINCPDGAGAILTLEAANNSTSMILAQDTTNALQPLEVVAASLNTSTINAASINAPNITNQLITTATILGENNGASPINIQGINGATTLFSGNANTNKIQLQTSTLGYGTLRMASYISGGNPFPTLAIGGDYGAQETLITISTLNCASLNGAPPALTSFSVQDVGALFSTLFAANPALSTIVY